MLMWCDLPVDVEELLSMEERFYTLNSTMINQPQHLYRTMTLKHDQGRESLDPIECWKSLEFMLLKIYINIDGPHREYITF